MEAFRKTISFLAGLILVLFGVFDECPRLGIIVIGLLLMGVFTVPEAISVMKGGPVKDSGSEDE